MVRINTITIFKLHGPAEKKGSEFFEVAKAVMVKTQKKGALAEKTKILIILFNDATRGHAEAVKSLAARNLGATDAGISETVRLAFMAGGLSGLAGMATCKEE